MPYRSDHSAAIARLLAEQGDAQARAALESGRAWGGAVQNIGQQVTGTLASLLQEKQDAPRRAMQNELGQLQLAAARREEAAAPQKELDAQAQRELAKDAQRATAIAKGAGAILGLSPQEQVPAYAAFRQQVITSGLAPAEAIPEQYNPGWLRYKLREAQSIDALAKSLEPKAPIEVSPGASLFDPETRQPVFTNQRPVEAPSTPNPTEASLALAAAGGDQKARRALALIRQQQRQPVDNGDPGPLETIIGPDGKAIRVPRRDAIGKPPAAGTEKASSGVQKRVLNFFNRAEQADKDLEALEPEIEKLSLAGQARQSLAPNFLQSQLGQSYTAAQRAFTEARLRKDSGAAIPPHEFESDRQTYFVQPGDSKKTIRDKNRARAAMLASLAFESGQALGEFLGDADEARATVERYKARAGNVPQSGAMVNMKAPDGTVKSVPAEQVEHYRSLGATVVGR